MKFPTQLPEKQLGDTRAESSTEMPFDPMSGHCQPAHKTAEDTTVKEIIEAIFSVESPCDTELLSTTCFINVNLPSREYHEHSFGAQKLL